MKKRILIVLPMICVLLYAICMLFTNWNSFNATQFAGLGVGIFVPVYFIWMQLTHKYIDIWDGFKLKSINTEEFREYNKTRKRVLMWVMIVILVVLILMNIFGK